MCFQHATGVSAVQDMQYYSELRDKIINKARQCVSMITPTPMEIDALNHARDADEWGISGIMVLQVSLGRIHFHQRINTNMKLILWGISRVVERVL